MPIGRRFAAISTAIITATAGLVAAPTAQAATVTLTPLDCQADSSATTTLGSSVSTNDVVSLTFSGCNGATFTWSADFAGAVNGSSESSPYNRNGSSQAVLELTATSTPSAGATILSVTDGTKTFVYTQPVPSVWTAKSPPASGVVGSSYSYQFTATTGSDPYSVASGSLPNGLSLSTTGLLSGTPTQTGAFTFSVARSGESETTGNLTITVTGPVIDKVTICHRTRATTNPYVVITVSVNSVIGSGGRNGHQDHNTTRTNSTNPTSNGITPGSGPFDTSFNYPSNQKWWGDIIPPFTYSGGTFAGLNWSPAWNYPDPTSGTSSWLEDDEFAAAVRAGRTYPFSSPSIYDNAAAQCLDLANGQQSAKSAEMDTPQKYFNVSVRNGEDPESIRDDLDDQQAEAMGGGTPGGSPISIPTTTSLETSYASTADVTTDAVTGTGRTSTTLNGTLKSGTTWTSWKFEWATAPEDVAGSANNFSSTTIPAANNAGDFEVDREITGLTCATQYYYRVTGTDNASPATTSVGLIRTFTTSACPGNSGGGNGNSGGGNSGGGNGNSGGNSGNTPGAGSTTPPGQTPTVGGGRPPRLTLPPAGPANRPVTPGNSATPGNSSTPGNSNSNSPGNGGGDDPTSTPGTSGTNAPGSPTNPVTTVYRPRNLTPTTSVPAPAGTEWEPTRTRIQDPETGEPVLRVTTEAGTWAVDERSGAITYTPTTGFAGSATVNVVLVARSGQVYIHPMRVPISFTSRVKVLSGDVPGDISGGVARIIRPWQR